MSGLQPRSVGNYIQSYPLPFIVFVHDARISCWRQLTGGIVDGVWGFTPLPPPGTDFHRGLDIWADAGTPVYAARSGYVEYRTPNNQLWSAGTPYVPGGNVPEGGNYVTILDEDGGRHSYGHLLSVTVSLRQWVAAGDLIGTVNDTGLSRADHLHYEYMDRHGDYKNPQTEYSCAVARQPG